MNLKNPKNTIQIGLFGPAKSGKTTTLFLFFQAFAQYFSTNWTQQDRQDFLALIQHTSNRVQGNFPAALTIQGAKKKFSLLFHDASYDPPNGYMDTAEHSYLQDIHLAIYCLDISNISFEPYFVLDELLHIQELLGINQNAQQKIPILIMANHVLPDYWPTWEQSDAWVRSQIASLQPGLYQKFRLFPKVQFWFSSFEDQDIISHPIPEYYQSQWPFFIQWFSQYLPISLQDYSACYSEYQRLHRIQNQPDLIFSHQHRWTNTQGKNFIMHLPSGQKAAMYYLDNDHRYWTTDLPSTGNFMVYDAEENQYIKAERLAYAPRYIKLENSAYVDLEKKLSGYVVVYQDRHILTVKEPRSYWDIVHRLPLKVAGPKGRFAIYPSGHVIDTQTAKSGFFDDIYNVVRLPGKRYFHIPTSFYWSRNQLWFAYIWIFLLSIFCFSLLGYIFPNFCIQYGFGFHKKQAIYQLLRKANEFPTATVESLILYLEQPEFKQDALLLLSRVAPPAPKALLQKTKSNDIEIRCFAAHILGCIKDPESMSYLLDLLKDPEPKVRMAAVLALNQLDYQNAGLYFSLAQMQSPLASDRCAAAQILGKITHEEAISTLTHLIEDVDPQVRKIAIYSIAPKKVKEAAPTLLKLLQDRNFEVAKAAAYALGEMCPVYRKLFQDILQLHSAKAKDRLRALQNLARNQPKAKYALLYVIPLLHDPDKQVVKASVSLLKQLQPTKIELYENIVRLKSLDPNECTYAAKRLAKIAAPQALPYLQTLLASPNPAIQNAAQAAVYEIKQSLEFLGKSWEQEEEVLQEEFANEVQIASGSSK